jgi:GTP cyclohydrolase I
MATGQPLDSKLRARLRRIVDAMGEKTARERLRLTPETMARALAGLGVRAATAEVIRLRIENIEEDSK